MTALDAAIDAVRKGGPLRTPALAELLGIGEAAVDAMLAPARADGRLICCDVEVGGRKVVEYRMSLSGGGRLVNQFKPYRSPVPVAPRADAETNEQVNAGSASHSSGPADQVAPGPRSPLQPRETRTMSVREKIEAALRKHGPMTVAAMRKHVDTSGLSGLMSKLARTGVTKKLGGGAKSGIYGLPDQQLPADALERGAELGRRPARAAGSRKRPLKRASRIAVAAARRAGRTLPKFRPALAADGAILCIGAEYGELELDKAQTRVLLDVSRKLKPTELAAVVTFLERLDAAEVGA